MGKVPLLLDALYIFNIVDVTDDWIWTWPNVKSKHKHQPINHSFYNQVINKSLAHVPLPVIAILFYIFNCCQLNKKKRISKLDSNINFCHSFFLCSVRYDWMQEEFVVRTDFQISPHSPFEKAPCVTEVRVCVCRFQVYKFWCWTAF